MYWWPGGDRIALAGAGLVSAWPRRNDMPQGMWTDLPRGAAHQTDVLTFAGLFLARRGDLAAAASSRALARPRAW